MHVTIFALGGKGVLRTHGRIAREVAALPPEQMRHVEDLARPTAADVTSYKRPV
jgi:hypothetical protein